MVGERVDRVLRWAVPLVIVGAIVLVALHPGLSSQEPVQPGARVPDSEGATAQAEEAGPDRPVDPAGTTDAGDTVGEPPEEEAWTPPRIPGREDERRAMVRTIRGYGLEDENVLAAMKAVPRHAFVPEKYDSRAYADTPLPIGHGQTISQPYIVAEMTRQLDLDEDAKVLEIGTGSGYQAAILTHCTPHVFSIEIVEDLATSAAQRLKRLGYTVVQVRHADGYHGWPAHAPFDAIIVTAAAGQIPPPLLRQLAPGGRMLIPVGGRFAVQRLMRVDKDEEGNVQSRSLMTVRFVPFTREELEAD